MPINVISAWATTGNVARSSIDTSSNTPFEALLCGTPVIVTDDCGCGEIIKEAGCGYLVRYGDVTGLGEALGFALETPDVLYKEEVV